jgi:hypothetical protein
MAPSSILDRISLLGWRCAPRWIRYIGGGMEHVKVTFPTHRLVYIDGEESGHTNEILRVDAGTHVFELGNLQNFRPASRNVSVQDTTVLEPRVIAFFRKDDA